tara:strand:- start:395 stop:796 length:402 start_codon:yes stop_codon:yes gene_type:complete
VSEHNEQVALFDWARMLEGRHPQLKMMFAIPNGGKRTNGNKLVREGLKKGVPDIFLSVPMEKTVYGFGVQDKFSIGWFHGLYIEMKFNKNKPTKEQKQWLEDLTIEGYDTAVCWSFDEAKAKIIQYLRLETCP